MGLTLFLVVLAYMPVSTCDWVYLDEGRAIESNTVLKQGYTLESVRWAFTTSFPDYWHPLPWLTHIADFLFFGDDAGGHHLTNLLFHLLNVILFFVFVKIYTGSRSAAILAATLLGLHPIHVESVAWIFERKDLMSMTFFLSALLSWRSYAVGKKWSGYVGAIVFLSLSLMAKPMAVSFPAVLLLLDCWPLGRLGDSISLHKARKLLVEKSPFILVAAAYSLFIYFHVSNTHGLVSWPLFVRIGNALTSFWKYLYKLFIPHEFAVFYPHSGSVSLAVFIAAAFSFVVLWFLAFSLRKKKPFLLWGLSWFCITLFPVSGIAQTGTQAMADRFVYIPALGLYVSLSYLLAIWIPRLSAKSKTTVIGSLCGTAILLTVLTNVQVQHWKNSRTLFEHSLGVAPGSALLHNNLGAYIFDHASDSSSVSEAKSHFIKAIDISPRYETAWANYGRVLLYQDSLERAKEASRHALRLDPCCGPALQGLGMIAERENEIEQSIEYHERAVECRPDMWLSHYNTARLRLSNGEFVKARSACRKSIRLNPFWASYDLLGRTFLHGNALDSALYYFSVASQHSPDAWGPYHNSGLVYAALGRHPQAILCFETALDKGERTNKDVHYYLALSLIAHGESGKAKRHLQAALDIAPEFAPARAALDRLTGSGEERTLEKGTVGDGANSGVLVK